MILSGPPRVTTPHKMTPKDSVDRLETSDLGFSNRLYTYAGRETRQIKSYSELQEQIRRDLLAQNPAWIDAEGNCAKCDEYDRRFAELISIFQAVEQNSRRQAA